MISCRSRVAALALALSLFAVPRLGAQETRCERGDVEVRSLSFSGNTAFADAVLAAGIVTTPSSWARRTLRIVGARHCLDEEEFPRDVLRLTVWYRNHGFIDATVDTVMTQLGPSRVAVRFEIVEGEPILIDTLRIVGLETVPEQGAIVANLPLRVGGRFDRYANSAARDTITRRLRDNGYPDAETFLGYDTRTIARTATVMFNVAPGPRRYVGNVVLTRTGRAGAPPEVTERAVRRLSGLATGELYRERLLERAKRTLYQSEAFTLVDVQPGAVGTDSLIDVNVDVTEGYLRSARIGAGWATLDCFRTTGEMSENNLFKTATRLELRGRVSKIGMGAPLDGAESLCARDARNDPFSTKLNYFASATVSQPALLRASFVPTLTLYSERRSEFKAYLRTTPVGSSISLTKSAARRTQSAGYSIEFGRTEAQPALFCAVFNACVFEDREALQRLQRLAVLSTASSYERTDNASDPTSGISARVEARHASALTGSDRSLQFTRLSVGGSIYTLLGTDVVIAGRVLLGAVLGPAGRFVPAQERLFAGGGTTVRGFRQNELGPAVYIPARYDTLRADGTRAASVAVGDTVFLRSADSVSQRAVPTGGNAMVVGNLEMRLASPFFQDLLRWTVFADVGRVWNRGANAQKLRFASLRVTPGIGVRIKTPIGYLRADVAYNGYPRVGGAAYFDAPLDAGGALYCVSPGNTLPVTRSATGTGLLQAAGACPSTFFPPRAASFFSRLTPSIAIGQAF